MFYAKTTKQKLIIDMSFCLTIYLLQKTCKTNKII